MFFSLPILAFLCSCKVPRNAHNLYILDNMVYTALERKQTMQQIGMLKTRIFLRRKTRHEAENLLCYCCSDSVMLKLKSRYD
jgi:hypothetical protein